jgi:hypothetical protein
VCDVLDSVLMEIRMDIEKSRASLSRLENRAVEVQKIIVERRRNGAAGKGKTC